jgi:hypothetical protein
MSNIDKLRKLDSELQRVLDKEKAEARSEADKDFFEQQVENAVNPILDLLTEQNNNLKEAVESLNNKLSEQVESFDKSIQVVAEAIKQVKIDTPTVNVPEIKVPELKMPEINVPEANITIDTKGIEKTLTEAIGGIKQPIVNVPKANISVKVPKMDFKWPEGDMSVKGIMELAGVNVENPLPVQLRDKNGKPVDFNSGGGSSGRSGYKSVKIEDETGIAFSNDNPIPTISGFDIPIYDTIEMSETSQTETFIYKKSGATVGTITVVYVSESKATILTVTKT